MPYDVWRRLDLFRHGAMDNYDYAVDLFSMHIEGIGNLPAGFTSLELGPGDALACGVVAKAYGSGPVYLVDQADFALKDPIFYARLVEKLVREASDSTVTLAMVI